MMNFYAENMKKLPRINNRPSSSVGGNKHMVKKNSKENRILLTHSVLVFTSVVSSRHDNISWDQNLLEIYEGQSVPSRKFVDGGHLDQQTPVFQGLQHTMMKIGFETFCHFAKRRRL